MRSPEASVTETSPTSTSEDSAELLDARWRITDVLALVDLKSVVGSENALGHAVSTVLRLRDNRVDAGVTCTDTNADADADAEERAVSRFANML